jgi:hypothetical protein
MESCHNILWDEKDIKQCEKYGTILINVICKIKILEEHINWIQIALNNNLTAAHIYCPYFIHIFSESFYNHCTFFIVGKNILAYFLKSQ